MLREMYINKGITMSYALILEDGKVKDFYMEDSKDKSISGNIYKGRIENNVKGLNAYFVNIGTGKNAMLHYEDAKSSMYERGKELIVQVKREPQEDKGARLSESIDLPGKYIIYIPSEQKIGISKKINSSVNYERLFSIKRELEGNYGGIIRTEAEFVDEVNIKNEFFYLKSLWETIYLSSNYLKVPCNLYNSKDFYSYIVREYLNSKIDKIYLNRKDDKNNFIKLLRENNISENEEVNCLNYEIFNIIKKLLSQCYKDKYNLKSGGFIYIDKTHSLTSIDVNSGKFISEGNKDQTAYLTNMEACREIFDIIKIRNITGIIIVDFIDIDSKKTRETMSSEISSIFINDKVYSKFYGFTNLGLMEMSRANKSKCVDDLIFYNNNLSKYTTSFDLKLIEDECIKNSLFYNKYNFNIQIPSDVYTDIIDHYSFFINEIKDRNNINIKFTVDDKVINFKICEK